MAGLFRDRDKTNKTLPTWRTGLGGGLIVAGAVVLALK
jgi:hypothetical protein